MPTPPERAVPTFSFQPRWKEELVCTCALGAFLLDLPMGRPTVYAPTAASWAAHAPGWAQGLHDAFCAELETWCAARGLPLVFADDAGPFPA